MAVTAVLLDESAAKMKNCSRSRVAVSFNTICFLWFAAGFLRRLGIDSKGPNAIGNKRMAVPPGDQTPSRGPIRGVTPPLPEDWRGSATLYWDRERHRRRGTRSAPRAEEESGQGGIMVRENPANDSTRPRMAIGAPLGKSHPASSGARLLESLAVWHRFFMPTSLMLPQPGLGGNNRWNSS
jgi:hypothetical protein